MPTLRGYFSVSNLTVVIPAHKISGARSKPIAMPVVVEVEKLMVFKLTINSMTNKITVSITLSKSFLYGWIQM